MSDEVQNLQKLNKLGSFDRGFEHGSSVRSSNRSLCLSEVAKTVAFRRSGEISEKIEFQARWLRPFRQCYATVWRERDHGNHSPQWMLRFSREIRSGKPPRGVHASPAFVWQNRKSTLSIGSRQLDGTANFIVFATSFFFALSTVWKKTLRTPALDLSLYNLKLNL